MLCVRFAESLVTLSAVVLKDAMLSVILNVITLNVFVLSVEALSLLASNRMQKLSRAEILRLLHSNRWEQRL